MNLNLCSPLRRSPAEMRIIRCFGEQPKRYSELGMRGHNGLDLEAEEGELVVAVDDGEVVEVRVDRAGYGLTVKLAHAWGESRYAHGLKLSVPIDFHMGHVVHAGERVMLAGSHLHFAVRLRKAHGSLDTTNANGFLGWDDPLPFLREALGLPAAPPPAAPASKAKKAA